MNNETITIRHMAWMGMLVALTIVFDSVFKLYQQVNGGSINLAMVGLVLIALVFPWWLSWLTTTIVFGLITAILDGYFAYYVFDYFFALSGFIIISFFKKSILEKKTPHSLILLSITFALAFLWRLLMHVISGVLYFEVDWLGSLTYNLTYLLPSFFLSYGVIVLIYYSSLLPLLRQWTSKRML